MLEILQFDFIQNGIIAGVLVSIIAGIIGSLIVVNRMVFLSGGIAHTSYGGIGLAVYFGFPIFLGASLFAVVAALLMAFVTLNNKDKIDIFIGLIWAVGMAIGIILIDLTPGYNVDLMSYLFGSILAVSKFDIQFMTILLFVVIAVILRWYKDILAVSYDQQYAGLRGINVKFFYTLILVISSLCIVISIKVVGLILVIALLTIPVYIAQGLSKSLLGMMGIAGALSTVSTLMGLYLSYMYDLSSGATIIMVNAIFLGVFLLYKKVKN